jgi:hypothetical protein
MPLTGKSLADGQLPTSKTTLYTVPASTISYVKHFTCHNTGGASEVITIYIKRSGSTSRVIHTASLATGETSLVAEKDDGWVLSAGDVIEGDTSLSATTVDYTILGGEDGP